MTADAPFGYFPGTKIARKSPPNDHDRGCKYCGKLGLIWEQQNGKWVYVDIGGKRHVCDIPKDFPQ